MKNSSNLSNVHDVLAKGQTKLSDSGIISARLDSQVLLGHVLGHDKTWLLSHPEVELSSTQMSSFEQLLSRRTQNIPVAYLTEHKEFYGRDFRVTPDVLVPRPETEDLVEQVLDLGSQNEPLHVLDIGTGSGIVAITLAIERPKWQITATDISELALQTARVNAKLHNVIDRIDFRLQNLLESDPRSYDIIVANLPYVPTTMKGKPDIAHEPDVALFAGSDGLELYRRLFAQANAHAQPPHYIYTESLLSQHDELAHIAQDSNYRLLGTNGLIQQFQYY